MAPKKQKVKVQFQKTEDAKMALEVKESEPPAGDQASTQQATESQPQMSDSVPATVTTSETTKKRYGSTRGVTAMHKVVGKKAQGKKSKIICNALGVPIGQSRHRLQSYVGMLARTMIPIDIRNWTSVESELKEKLWHDIQETFNVAEESKNLVLKSAASKWRQFKANLTKDYVKPNLGQKKKLRKPPKRYGFVGKDAWKRFVAERNTDEWVSLSETQSKRVSKRKYHHRASRKGYIGLLEEEEKSGKLEPGEIPDRAILWKKARKPKGDNTVIDEELAKIHEKIDVLLEKKHTGEFKPCGSDDVLSTALETPEHSGRVRGVGSFVTPTMYFNLPKGKRCRITKAELLARDRQRDADLEKTKQEMAAELEKTKQQMAELKAMLKSNNPSPILSDRASCQPKKSKEQLEGTTKSKPLAAKELMVDDDECVAIFSPTPPQNKGPRQCELAVDNVENKVAFGMVFDEEDMNITIHGVPLEPGCARVSVDGILKGDALVPVPVPGEIETVSQAVGSHVSWPRDLITFPNVNVVKKKKEKEAKNELQKIQSLFNKVAINKNVPDRFRLLYKHATTFMSSTGTSIQIPCDAEVFGAEKRIFILHENIIALLEFKMIGQAAISAYMAYLHTVVRANDDLEQFGFCDPGYTFTLNNDFEAYIVNRLKEGNADRLFLMPHNENYHWILIVIWEGQIYILNPLPRSTSYPHLEKALSSAIESFNCATGRGNKLPQVKYISGCPKQPGGTECGYVVMRYMKEIIEDSEMDFVKKWSVKNRKVSYSRKDLDEVRFEALSHIEGHM